MQEGRLFKIVYHLPDKGQSAASEIDIVWNTVTGVWEKNTVKYI